VWLVPVMSLHVALPQASVLVKTWPVSSKVKVVTALVQAVEPTKHCLVIVVALPRVGPGLPYSVAGGLTGTTDV